jgi:hypothetical protein
VDHVAAGHQQAHQAVGGKHQPLVTVKQTDLARLNVWRG